MKRKLFSFVLACIVAMGTMPLMGCNKQAVLNDVQKFAPAVTNLLTIACEFTASPLCATGGALLNAAEQHLFTVWQGFLDQEQKGSTQPGAWNDLNAALQDLITKSQDVFALTHVVNAQHQNEVLAVAASVQALLAVIESFLPPQPAVPGVQAMIAPRQPRMATFLPAPNAKTKKYDRAWFQQWKADYNKLPAVQARHLQIKTGLFGL